MKTGFLFSLQVVALGTLLSQTASAAGHYILNNEFNVRLQPSSTAKVAGTLKKFNWQPLKLDEVPNKPDWVKLTSEKGNYAFLHKDALKKVELHPDYELRTEPSLEKSTILGRTGKTSDIVFTGAEQTVTEGKKSIKWLEAWSVGKRVWIAAKAQKTTAVAATSPAPAKVDRKTASTPPAPSTAKPAVQPAAKPAIAANPPAAAAKPVVPPAAKPTEECVNTPDQFAKNPRLVKAFGSTQPFTHWKGDYDITLEPSSGGVWTLRIPPIVVGFMKVKPGEKRPDPVSQIPLKVCIDKSEKPFVNAFGKDYPFKDSTNSKIELQYGSQSVEFTRSTVAR